MGLAAEGFPVKAILVGIIAATVLRIGFASVMAQLLTITGLLLVGGRLLVWVCWKMWRELCVSEVEALAAQEALANSDLNEDGTIAGSVPAKTFRQAAIQIVIADVSMSLDNVLAVAGAARDHPTVLVVRLILSGR